VDYHMQRHMSGQYATSVGSNVTSVHVIPYNSISF